MNNGAISIMRLRQMAGKPLYATVKSDLLLAADTLERLSNELDKEQNRAAQDQVYTSGYNHSLAVGQEQRILNTKLDEEL
jgi:hypothetical protein